MVDADTLHLSASQNDENGQVQLQPFGQGPRFSILMAAYNRAELIHVAIDSVLAQDFGDYELVIVDDGSTDETPDIVTRYTDPRIRYIRKSKNEGRSPTRNRAIAEARGEFVLWMADDDLLEPHVLRTYDDILRAEPHVDVVYGKLQLFDHETGDDLNVFTPNDWTGRDQEVIGAKLYGSCVPDGGSAVRRAVYGKVGSGPYDHEFVRAQDYELWTRIVGQASFRFVDEIVYRYRKHDGGTSWGEFIDLTLDSKIIRRHLTRHSLKTLFPRFNWKYPDWAQNQAHLRIAKNLQMYGDHGNVLRFLESIPNHTTWPEALEYRVRSLLAMGHLDRAKTLLDSAHINLGYHDQRVQTLKGIFEWLMRFSREAPTALNAGHYDAVIQDALAFNATHFQTFETMRCRAIAHEKQGQLEAALHAYCLAARLNLEDHECTQATERLRAVLGATPKTDLAAMRRRLRERFYDLPDSSSSATPTSGLVTVFAVGQLPIDTHQHPAIEALLRQTHADFEVISTVPIGPSHDARFRCVESVADWRSEARGQWVAWLDFDVIWAHHFLETSVKTLSSGASAVVTLGQVTTEISDGAFSAELIDDVCLSMASLMDSPQLSVGHLVHRMPIDGDPPLPQNEHRLWPLLLAWISTQDWVLNPGVNLTRTGRPAGVYGLPDASSDTLKSLMAVYQNFGSQTAFDSAARDAQNRRLHPLGFHQVRRGKTTVALFGATNVDLCRDAVESLRAVTWAAHEILIVLDRFHPNDIGPLSTWIDEQSDIRVYRPRGEISAAKIVNDTLARAHSECVAIVHAGSRLMPGWLGQLQYQLHVNESWGIISPQWRVEHLSEQIEGVVASAVERIDEACCVIHRRVIEHIGGMDVTLGADGLHWLDYGLRVRLAGFSIREADGMSRVGPVPSGEASENSEARFVDRWGSLEPDLSVLSFDAVLHVQPLGAETGFRPDGRPVEIVESGLRNVLIIPPWDNSDAMVSLMLDLAGIPRENAFWFRTPHGQGQRYVDALHSYWESAGLSVSEQPNMMIVDAYLAPEREAGLYLAANVIFVDENWSNARRSIRRASDCGRPVLRGRSELHAWAEANA